MLLRTLSTRALVLTLALGFLGAGVLTGQSALGERRNERLSTDRFWNRPPRFVVELQVEEVGIHGFFTEVTGLSSENEVVEFRDGNDPNVVRKLPGVLRFGDVTLKRGVTADGSLWQWRHLVEVGNVAQARATARIILLDRGTPVARWTIANAWPSKISAPDLNAKGNDVALETLVLSHEGLTLE